MTDKLISWPEERISISRIRKWIQHSLMDVTDVIGPIEVYRSNSWGVTARFSVVRKNFSEDIVCKLGYLPIFQTSPAIYKLLNKYAIEYVPKIIFSEQVNDETWMLFLPFEGESVKGLKSLDTLCEVAKTMAKIQTIFNGIEYKKFGIPVIEPKDIKQFTTNLFESVKEKYWESWKQNSVQLIENFGLSREQVEQLLIMKNLEELQREIIRYCDKLDDEFSPLSIVHLDFHSGNACLTNKGEIIIFDWEEATISLPFFTMDKILDDAYSLGGVSAEILVRDYYLNNLMIGNHISRKNAFIISRVVSHIFYIHQSLSFIKQVGWSDNEAGFVAEALVKTMERVSSIQQMEI